MLACQLTAEILNFVVVVKASGSANSLDSTFHTKSPLVKSLINAVERDSCSVCPVVEILLN